ncbi:MAG: hypothetical protein A3F17_06485 [Gammaproteobacteria bacterium RIFCSPHIGHO2_12_FULL_41_15]|nr:MAG: hypothetical protein A3F17_06485 [Gammaproteobacteria bacterium RIFCSPHIGHO2_12_FULL_41_15]
MYSTPIFPQLTKQDEICIYLQKISTQVIDEKKAMEMLKHSECSDQFIIGNEIKLSLPEQNRYFQIYFEDIRMDESSFQTTPSVVFMKGIIKISKQGELTVSDDRYSTDINAKFFFENNVLKMDNNSRLLEKQSGQCVIL